MARAKKYKIAKEILDDLCTKFIINVSIDEPLDITKFCAHVEQAHWHCVDFYKKKCSLKVFAHILFEHVPFLSIYADNVDEIVDKFKL